MSQTNKNDLFHFQYWLVKDAEVASQLGIDTSDERVGDMYIMRKQSAFTDGLQHNLNIGGYNFVSEKLFDVDDQAAANGL
jgi:hypothetical protein